MEQQEEILTPSYHGELCRHNGENPDYEIACDECDFYLICFPDWKEMIEIYDFNDKIINSIKTSPDKALEAYLRANAKKEHIFDIEQEINSQVKEELTSRRRKEQTQYSKKFPFYTIQSSLLDIFICSIKLKEVNQLSDK